MKISMVVAMTKEGIIGDNNMLLWHLPNDLKRFKSITLNKPIVMGRKTYESIGRPLPNRRNIILTRERYHSFPGCEIMHSVQEILDATEGTDELMVIGGGEIYRLFWPLTTHLYITYVNTSLSGDTSFPSFNMNEWQEVSRESHDADEKHAHSYVFINYIRSEHQNY